MHQGKPLFKQQTDNKQMMKVNKQLFFNAQLTGRSGQNPHDKYQVISIIFNLIESQQFNNVK